MKILPSLCSAVLGAPLATAVWHFWLGDPVSWQFQLLVWFVCFFLGDLAFE